jgi:hypothetical protein
MLITGEVTLDMMAQANMTRGTQLGVPKDPLDPSKGLVWKDIHDLSDEDFDAIEMYFKRKKQ